MTRRIGVVAGMMLALAASAAAQETGIQVRAVRVLATDAEALAAFYEKAFGFSETRRPIDRPTMKEIIINAGTTKAAAEKATSAPIVIMSRGQNPPGGATASLILQVPSLDTAVASATAAGATVFRQPNTSAEGLRYAFLKDPDGNQIELVEGW